jgi:hypothetical protein
VNLGLKSYKTSFVTIKQSLRFFHNYAIPKLPKSGSIIDILVYENCLYLLEKLGLSSEDQEHAKSAFAQQSHLEDFKEA